MPRPRGNLERSLAALTVGVVKGQQDRERALSGTRLREVDQQLRAEVSGTAGPEPVSAEQTLDFRFPLVFAPAQRNVQFENPHFTFGTELLVPTPVIVIAQVVGWVRAAEGWATGAKVRFTAWSTSGEHTYRAAVHLVFQGFGAPSEDEEG